MIVWRPIKPAERNLMPNNQLITQMIPIMLLQFGINWIDYDRYLTCKLGGALITLVWLLAHMD